MKYVASLLLLLAVVSPVSAKSASSNDGQTNHAVIVWEAGDLLKKLFGIETASLAPTPSRPAARR